MLAAEASTLEGAGFDVLAAQMSQLSNMVSTLVVRCGVPFLFLDRTRRHAGYHSRRRAVHRRVRARFREDHVGTRAGAA